MCLKAPESDKPGATCKVIVIGNIRQTYIKSTADTLLRLYPGQFGTDFQANKLTVTSQIAHSIDRMTS